MSAKQIAKTFNEQRVTIIMDYTKFFAKRVAKRHENLIRKFTEMRALHPTAISLAGGMPNSNTFPIKNISITYNDDIVENLAGPDLHASLQYGPSQGHFPLLKKYQEFQEKRHNPPFKNWDVVFVPGSQQGFCNVLDLIMNEGDAIMVQVPTYTATLGAVTSSYTGIPISGTRIEWVECQKNPETYPIEEISFCLKDGTLCTMRDADLHLAMRMAQPQGIPKLLQKLRELQMRWHSPPNNVWDVLVANGSQDGISRIFEAFIDVGDPVMVQTPIYFGAAGAIHPLLPDFIGIQQDADGIIPEEIERACEARAKKNQPLPKLLYVNPIGANPTGSMLSHERKLRIYELARKYDFLIVEDDPYYFLHFLDEQPTSFLSMDVDGRVIRLDSFSKIISAGLRLGVVTAHKEIIKKLIIHIENSVLHSSSLSQMLIYKLFELWNHERFDQHFKEIQCFYKQKRDVMLAAVEKHLTGIAEWSVPKGGMFLWIKITAIDSALDLAMDKLAPHGVFVIPGNAFNYDRSHPDQHFRLCYSFATAEEVDKGLSIIGKVIREEAAKPRNIGIEK